MNTQAFSTIVYENTEALQRYAYKFTQDFEDAQDLMQDTMVKAIRFSHQFEKGSDMKAWLFTIMRNTFINDYRKKVKKNALITTEEEISFGHLMHSASKNAGERKFMMHDIQTALGRLAEAYRVPFVRYFEGYKYEEIAEELNIPLGTVKTRIHQARQLLKQQLQNYRDEVYMNR